MLNLVRHAAYVPEMIVSESSAITLTYITKCYKYENSKYSPAETEWVN